MLTGLSERSLAVVFRIKFGENVPFYLFIIMVCLFYDCFRIGWNFQY